MRNFFLSASLFVTVWLPLVQENAVRMNQSQAAALYNAGQVEVVRLYEDGSAYFRWDSTLFSGCIIPDYGCGD